MDSATIKGVVERLMAKKLVALNPDPGDKRLRLVSLTGEGAKLIQQATEQALAARTETLERLDEAEAATLEALLAKLV